VIDGGTDREDRPGGPTGRTDDASCAAPLRQQLAQGAQVDAGDPDSALPDAVRRQGEVGLK